MPKKFIPLVLLITLTLGPVSGVFGSIMDKIKSYSIYLPGTDNKLDLFNRDLWFSSTSKDIEVYASAIESSPYNPMGANAIIAYSTIGADNQTMLLNDGTEIGLVNSPPEYYFTDMVFIQQKYEEALVDLYFYRAEASGSSRNTENRAIMDEAIAGTYWVAQQNGVTYTEEQIREKFMQEFDELMDPIVESFINENKGRFADIESYTSDLVDKLKSYYLDPCLETFEGIISSAYDFEDAAGTIYLDTTDIFIQTVSYLSSGLSTSLVNYATENENKFTPR